MSDIALPSFGTFVDSNTVYLNTSDVHLVRRQFLVAGTLIAGIVGGLNIARALTIIAINVMELFTGEPSDGNYKPEVPPSETDTDSESDREKGAWQSHSILEDHPKSPGNPALRRRDHGPKDIYSDGEDSADEMTQLVEGLQLPRKKRSSLASLMALNNYFDSQFPDGMLDRKTEKAVNWCLSHAPEPYRYSGAVFKGDNFRIGYVEPYLTGRLVRATSQEVKDGIRTVAAPCEEIALPNQPDQTRASKCQLEAMDLMRDEFKSRGISVIDVKPDGVYCAVR